MSSIEIGRYGRIEINDNIQCHAEGSYYSPILVTNLTLICNPFTKDGKMIPYKLIEIIGELRLEPDLTSSSHVNYLFNEVREKTDSYPVQLQFPLDIRIIRRMEEVRRGNDISFELTIKGIIFLSNSTISNLEHLIELRSIHPIKITIPQSHWVKNILSKWKYGQVELIEIYFPENYEHELLKESFGYIITATSHFNNGNDRETLASVYAAFELLAKKYECKDPDQNFFSKFLCKIEDDKRDKLKLLFDTFCDYLHLGRHESNKPPVIIDHRDSKFALTMAQLIFSYLSKILPKEEK